MIKLFISMMTLIFLSSLCFAKRPCEAIESDQILIVSKNLGLAIEKKIFTNEKIKKSALNIICSIENLSPEKRYDYEDEWHDAHQFLGLMAFVQNDFETSKAELIKSINKEKKGTVISSFGPRGELARLLLKKDYTKEVMAYLESAISVSFSKNGENSRGQMECCLDKIKNKANCNISEIHPDHWFNLCK